MSVSSSPTKRGWRGDATGRSAVWGTVFPQHRRRISGANAAGPAPAIEVATTPGYLRWVLWRPRFSSLRRRFTPRLAAGYLLRGMVSNGMLDGLARTYNSASFQKAIHWLVWA